MEVTNVVVIIIVVVVVAVVAVVDNIVVVIVSSESLSIAIFYSVNTVCVNFLGLANLVY